MTNQEAMENIRIAIAEVEWEYPMEYAVAFEMAIKALEKWNETKGIQKMTSDFLNKKVIVRGDRSGVFFGTLVEREGQEVKLEKCRRIWYWDGAASISQLAKEGTKKPNKCKFTITVDSIVIFDAIEIILCTDEAIKSIEGVEEWKM